jgi:predicted phage terminase large subunit-like protein
MPATGSKEVRANALRAQAEAGNVGLLRSGWNAEFLDEAEIFPNGTYLDQIDGAAHAMNDLVTGPRAVGVREVRWG